MTDNSPTPPNASTDTQRIPLLANVLKAEYRCPICDVVVVSIQDGVARFAPSHVSLSEDAEGYTVLAIYHQGTVQPGKNTPEFHPPHPRMRPTVEDPE